MFKLVCLPWEIDMNGMAVVESHDLKDQIHLALSPQDKNSEMS